MVSSPMRKLAKFVLIDSISGWLKLVPSWVGAGVLEADRRRG